jgi:hydrogenase maturation protease
MSELLIIGIGQEYRSDDRVGRWVARSLQKRTWPGVEVLESTGDGTELMRLWEGHRRVWLVDAVTSQATPGSLHRISVHRQALPNHLFKGSTHHWGVAEAVEMSRLMGTLPEEVELYGIESRVFEYGIEMSEPVTRAGHQLIQTLCSRVEKELSCTK